MKVDDLLLKCGVKNETETVPPSLANSDDENEETSGDDYVEFEDLSKKMKSIRRRKVRPATESDKRAYNTLGLDAPAFVPLEPSQRLPPYDL